jgi:predicted esterase
LAIGIPALAAALLLVLAAVRRRQDPPPALALEDTGMADFAAGDFDAVHSSVDGKEFLIFGNLSSVPPAADLPDEYAAFLGRWEGYGYGPPVKKDWKYVLTVREISSAGGKAYLWAGTNLQYPTWKKEISFRFVPGKPAAMEWKYSEKGKERVWAWTYDPGADVLRGWLTTPSSNEAWGPVELNRGRSFRVYRDYPAYLAENRIYPVSYRDDWLARYFGTGFLLYLPEGYAEDPGRVWPMILFLHGTGDRGENVFLPAKASPLAMVREQGPLPFIIVAPLLGKSGYYGSFPESYLDGVLEQVLADYRVDRTRIYGTGVSIGGEAIYRFAVYRPDLFAAIAPLSGYLESTSGLERLSGLPVWVVHGADDPVIPLNKAQRDVDALKQTGADVVFTILENHDHDVWTDTYADPLFYEWLLRHARP